MLTFSEINERNAKFWLRQSQLCLERISDETIFELAQKEMAFEMLGVPIRFQKTLERALADAAENVRISLKLLSRKGGKAPKTSASTRSLIYQKAQEESFDLIDLKQASAWVDSPLSDELQDDFRSGYMIYLRAIFHLHEFLSGRRVSLTVFSRYKAWKTVAEIPEESVSDLLR